MDGATENVQLSFNTSCLVPYSVKSERKLKSETFASLLKALSRLGTIFDIAGKVLKEEIIENEERRFSMLSFIKIRRTI